MDLFQRDNAKEHRTFKYDILDKANPALVIRRGDPFFMSIQLRNAYDQDNNKIRLEFLFGMCPIYCFLNFVSLQFNTLHTSSCVRLVAYILIWHSRWLTDSNLIANAPVNVCVQISDGGPFQGKGCSYYFSNSWKV